APLTGGIRKTVSWWTGAGRQRWSGELWELEAAELRPRARPQRAQAGLEAPERAVLAQEQVNEEELRAWLVRHDLALIVTRDQTSRDRADLQQPFNLRVPDGVQTRSKRAPDAKVYEIAHFQLFEGEQLRAYPGREGRRVIAQPLHDGRNPDNPGGPAGSVRIAPDGSTAAFVPARRALSWQSTDRAGEAVVRERNWITFQAGEMRVCASCHGVNTRDQAERLPPVTQPEALRALLAWWKTQP
ncbi:HzsA-related protein, partial [Massilia terrae]